MGARVLYPWPTARIQRPSALPPRRGRVRARPQPDQRCRPGFGQRSSVRGHRLDGAAGVRDPEPPRWARFHATPGAFRRTRRIQGSDRLGVNRRIRQGAQHRVVSCTPRVERHLAEGLPCVVRV
jgi:hypothetical protein